MSWFLLAGGVAALAVGAALFFSYRQGAASERGRQAIRNSEVTDAEIEASNNRPVTRADLSRRLRADDF
ncbi:MAG TPA: hypothetical protein VMG55_09520 [Stellaceae bacterium]|nr:hypothetical protein [Stellaceae bacterium]